MSEFVPLIAVDRVIAGKSVLVSISDRYFVVCKCGERIFVTDCVCPHAGGPLGDADVRDGCIICPVHHWPWNLETGLTDSRFPEMRLCVYPCEIRGGIVYADISVEQTISECDLDARDE